MPIAALYDIHGNLPALDAVLADLEHEQVDTIVVGGDVVPGPMPVETLERLLGLDLPVRFLHGNGESAVLAEAAGEDPGVPEAVREVIRWTAEALGPALLEEIRGWLAARPGEAGRRLQSGADQSLVHAAGSYACCGG
jgi:hypothetical protein